MCKRRTVGGGGTRAVCSGVPAPQPLAPAHKVAGALRGAPARPRVVQVAESGNRPRCSVMPERSRHARCNLTCPPRRLRRSVRTIAPPCRAHAPRRQEPPSNATLWPADPAGAPGWPMPWLLWHYNSIWNGCGPHLKTEPYVQPSASVLWSNTSSQAPGSSLGWGENTSGWPSASLHVGRSSRAGDCLQGRHKAGSVRHGWGEDLEPLPAHRSAAGSPFSMYQEYSMMRQHVSEYDRPSGFTRLPGASGCLPFTSERSNSAGIQRSCCGCVRTTPLRSTAGSRTLHLHQPWCSSCVWSRAFSPCPEAYPSSNSRHYTLAPITSALFE